MWEGLGMGKSENDYTVFIIRQVRPFCSEVVGAPYVIQCTQLALLKYLHTKIHYLRRWFEFRNFR